MKSKCKNYNDELKKVQFKIPESINLFKILTEHGLIRDYQYIPYYNYFLYLIYRDQKYTSAPVGLKAIYLRNVISRNSTLENIKNNLVKMGIIEINDSYQVNEKCKNYKICDKYMDNKVPYYKVPYYSIFTTTEPLSPMLLQFPENSTVTQDQQSIHDDKNLLKSTIKKYKKIRKTLKEKLINRFDELLKDPCSPQYRYIQQNILNTTVDTDVYDKIEQMKNEKTKLRPGQIEYMKSNQKIRYWKKERIMSDDNNIAESWIEDAKMVECGVGKITCPANTKRLYSTITSYPSLLRGFLRYKDKKLWYIDVSNCQPLLFLHFIYQHIQGEIPPDLSKYAQLVSDGQLYEYLMVAMGKTDIIKKDVSNMTPDEIWDYESKRSMFKIDFFARVFFSNEKRNYTERKKFAELFPTVSNIITQLKKSHHSNLSLRLQRFEAHIILDRVFYQLSILYPDSYAVPIHDAIVCEEHIKDIVYDIMVEEIENAIGVTPKLKVEEL